MIGRSQHLWEVDYALAFSLSDAFFEACKHHFLSDGPRYKLALDMLMAQYKQIIQLANFAKPKCRSKLDEVCAVHNYLLSLTKTLQLTVISWHIQALANLDEVAALEYGIMQLSTLCNLHITDDPKIVESLRQEASFGDLDKDQILEAIPLGPPEGEVVVKCAILGALIAVSFVHQPTLSECIELHYVISARQGFTEHLPLAMSGVALFNHQAGKHKQANTIHGAGEILLRRVRSP